MFIPGILAPTGNLGALNPHQVVVSPIAATDVTANTLVRFDLTGTLTSASDIAKLYDLDEKNCPFNVVRANGTGAAAASDFGIYGVAREAATAGSRVKVCIAGLVQVRVFATTSNIITMGQKLSPDGSNADLMTQQADNAPCIGAWLGLATSPPSVGSITASATALSNVLFNGVVFGSSGS